jgi:Phage tail assembly chaperone protein
MYAKVSNGNIEAYPYGVGDLARENPNVSFPDKLSDESLSAFGLVEVIEGAKPKCDDRTQRLELSNTPELIDGVWTVQWKIIDKTDEEVRAYDQKVIEFVKSERNKRLAETDWMALSDNVMSPEWVTYRQALRDVTNQKGFPYNIVWPVMPK